MIKKRKLSQRRIGKKEEGEKEKERERERKKKRKKVGGRKKEKIFTSFGNGPTEGMKLKRHF